MGRHGLINTLAKENRLKRCIAGNLSIETDDFEYAPFSQKGGIGKVYQVFGDELNTVIDELNEMLVA